MRNVTLYGLAAAAAGMLALTSCLGDGSNTQTAMGYGVVDFDMNAFGNVVKDDYGTVLYSTAFAGLNVGDFVMYYATIDWDAQTSSNYITATVDQNGFARLDRYYSDPIKTDTSKVLTNETTITEAAFIQTGIQTSNGFDAYVLRANSHAFLTTAFQNVPSDREFSYELTYDGDLRPVQVEGNNVYDLYLRATVTDEGDNVESNYSYAFVFDLSSFLSRTIAQERAEGEDYVYVRLWYPKAFNSDSTQITWDKTDVAKFPIPQES